MNETINHSHVSFWRKDLFRQSLETLKKSLSDLDNAKRAHLFAKSLEECKEFVQKNPSAKFVVKDFKVGGESRPLNEIMKSLRNSLADASLMLFSIEELNGKLVCLSNLPDVSIIKICFYRSSNKI